MKTAAPAATADGNGGERGGDDLYSDCLLALDAKTGKLKWHYQTTPHDLRDWDTTETPLVLDANGRPMMKPDQDPSEKGTRVCPSQDGATNWYSPSFNPATGLFYMQTNEKCPVYSRRPENFVAGHAFLGGAQRVDSTQNPKRIPRALDLQTGKVKWEIPQVGTANSWGGTIATATGLIFFGEDSGAFAAADATTGKVLWSFQTSQNWKSSPMAYQFDGKEYIGVAAGSSNMAFGLE